MRPSLTIQGFGTPAMCAALAAAMLAGCKSTPRSEPVAASTGAGPTRRERQDAAREVQAREYMEQARELREAGRDDEALALLSRAIEQNPTLTVAHVEMGSILETQGDYESAERSFGTAAQQQPTNFDAQFGHGRVLQTLNRLAEAVRAYLRALAIRPDNFEANLNLSYAYVKLDGPAQALPYAQRAVQLSPADGAARANLGAIYSDLGRHREAVDEYFAASELLELSPPLLLNLSESLGKLSRYDEMINTLDVINRVQPSAASWERTGFALFKIKKFTDAQAAFRRSIELDASYFPALNGLGVCLLNTYILSNKTDAAALTEAMNNFKRSLRIRERQPRIVELIARYER